MGGVTRRYRRKAGQYRARLNERRKLALRDAANEAMLRDLAAQMTPEEAKRAIAGFVAISKLDAK